MAAFHRRNRPTVRELKHERRSSSLPVDFMASFGIVGKAGVGRKTLGYRFQRMNAGVLEAVPIQNFYMSNHRHVIHRDFAGRTRRVYLRGFIIEPPRELEPPPEPERRRIPYYIREWNRFCCLVFVYDVTSMDSLVKARRFLIRYRVIQEDLPPCYLVGNKTDLRGQGHPDEVDTERAQFEALQYGATYHECSARMNHRVQPLLNVILRCAVLRH